jgi:small ligand-binding sensory domain FIST
MKWASALSQQPATLDAVAEAAASLRADLAGAAPHLVLAFASPHHARGFEDLPDLVAAELPGALLCGCSGGGIIGSGHEVEQGPALSLTAASLPGVDLMPLRFPAGDDLSDAVDWPRKIGVSSEPTPAFVLLPDPFTCDAAALVAGLDDAYPASCKVGGLASGATRSGQNALFLGRETYRDGAVGVALSGDVVVDTIVAQGCRPVGKPFAVTRCEDNAIIELDGKPALSVVKDVFESLSAHDRDLFRHSLFIGLEMRESAMEFREGEFLVRNIVGTVPEAGAILVGASLHSFQVVQFLLRDAATATDDLERQLDAYRKSAAGSPTGALLFSCLGRGAGLFGRADHDTDLFRDRIGSVPVGGFFCNGEIGPVGGTTFLHGYTSSFGLFRGKAI